MTNEKIIEGNKLISEFLFPDLEENIALLTFDNVLLKISYLQKDFENMHYHDDCSWQEYLIGKIESLENIHVQIDGKSCRIFNFTDMIISQTRETKKLAIFWSCVDFIKFIDFNKKH